MCTCFSPDFCEARLKSSLVEGQSNGHDWSSGIKTEKNGRKLSRGGEKGRREKREERKIGKVGNRWLSLMRSLPGEWKQEKLRTGGGTYKLLDRYSVICLKQR